MRDRRHRRERPASLLAALVVVVALGIFALFVVSSAPDPDVLVLGDSLTVIATGVGLHHPKWVVDARAGRRTPEAIEQARLQHADRFRVVVVAVGTNDRPISAGAYARRIDELMDVIGPEPLVVWINADTRTPQLASAVGVNEALEVAPARYPNLCVADWDRYITTIPTWDSLRQADGIHYGREGSGIRAQWTLVQGLSAKACVARAHPRGS